MRVKNNAIPNRSSRFRHSRLLLQTKSPYLTSVFENVRENTTSFQPLDAAQVGSGKGKVYSDNAIRREKIRLVFKILMADKSEINIALGNTISSINCTPLTKRSPFLGCTVRTPPKKTWFFAPTGRRRAPKSYS